MPQRVAVTGIGAITAAGFGTCALWNAAAKEISCVRNITRFDASDFNSRTGAEIDGFRLSDFHIASKASRLDRFSELALAASAQALKEGRLDLHSIDRSEVGVFIGSALGGIAFGEEQHERFMASGIRSVAPGLALSVFSGAAATNVSIAFGLCGPSISNANSCAAGAIAIGEAFRSIRDGRLEMALAGGVEAPLAPLTYGSFSRIKAMSTRNEEPETACRPFDTSRDGFVMGEGAAMLLLEEWSAAEDRGAEIYGELLGYATTSDAHHMTVPLPDGREAARAITGALDSSNLSPIDIGYIQAHATGTRLGDSAEAAAIRSVFGSNMPPVSSSKPVHGHALGASPAIELALTLLALAHGHLPATPNLNEPADDCRLNHVPKGGLEANGQIGLSNAFGFGGINACLIVRAAHRDEALPAG